MSSVYVVARFLAKEDKVEELKAALESLVEPTRKEEGCISYQIFQNNNNPAEFTFFEEWASQDAINAHFTTPHVQAAIVAAPGLLSQEMDIRYYSLVK
jgi:quinol monooxygenase YgiN